MSFSIPQIVGTLAVGAAVAGGAIAYRAANAQGPASSFASGPAHVAPGTPIGTSTGRGSSSGAAPRVVSCGAGSAAAAGTTTTAATNAGDAGGAIAYDEANDATRHPAAEFTGVFTGARNAGPTGVSTGASSSAAAQACPTDPPTPARTPHPAPSRKPNPAAPATGGAQMSL